MTPTQLPNESLRAFETFKRYVALGDKRSIRLLCRKHGKHRATCEKWSKKYRWQARLRQMELEDAKRSARAAEEAALTVAEEKERLKLRHTVQKLRASERLFERAHEVLKESTRKSRAPDAAKMFAVAAALGNEALGLEGSTGTGHFGLHPTAPINLKVVFRGDAHSVKVKELEDGFFKRHPEIKRPRNGLEMIEENGSELPG